MQGKHLPLYGKEWDEETGNFYYGARYYDPKISVWLSVDPILKAHESPYCFTSNNPIMLIDPDGRDTTFASRAAQDRFNAAYSNTLKKMVSLEKDIDKDLDKFIGGEMSSRSDREYMNKLQKYSELREAKNDFEAIIDPNSDCVRYEINDEKAGKGNAGSTGRENGQINVYLSEGYSTKTGNESVIVHENTHVNQIFNGLTSRSRSAEYAAYRRQAAYSPDYVQGFISNNNSSTLIQAINKAYSSYPKFHFVRHSSKGPR